MTHPRAEDRRSDVVEKCWACPAPAAVRYIAWDEPEMPAPRYCEDCSAKFPPCEGIGRLRL